ncbi:aldehyde dehydrogenase [Nocardia higoensis]|uniref:Aldehyde dehydrogenase n=1 Tax=Nocardia higoensis TaxID=228599 RepID=A0ABS0DBM7_9NOCA|nr:aldehyde dehydrogenase family protein [Nocardia higoensis]MBF6355870.1 aldehyde dehydrogenase [Nocardia higoensis]
MVDAVPIDIPALGPSGEFRAANRLTVTDVSGAVLAEVSLVPPVFVRRSMAALHRAETLPATERAALLAEAAELFDRATIGGLSPADYQHAVSRAGGVPISSVREANGSVARRVANAFDSAHRARPRGSAADWQHPSTRAGRAVWVRRGSVFAVHAAGNHPGTHAIWPEALALGYRVAVRPSSRDPFTPYRLITALRTAGFPADHVVMLPTDHAGAEGVLRGADLGMVYGGADVVAKYRGTQVSPQGPGRSKILITADTDWRRHLDVIVESVADHGGTGCVSASAVLVEGDPAPLAEAIAERLAAIPSLPPEHPQASLPVQQRQAARAIESYLLKTAAGARAWLGGAGVVDELGDGSAVLRPAVYEVDDPAAPQIRVELPFPCVWVAPWTRAAGIAPLRDTLVLTVLTEDDELLGRLVDEPTIRNVYLGDRHTHWMASGVPHDGFLGDFLMWNKGIVTSTT